jgi:hypothetical protein
MHARLLSRTAPDAAVYSLSSVSVMGITFFSAVMKDDLAGGVRGRPIMHVLAIFLVSCALACLCGIGGFLVVYAFTTEGPLLLTGLGIGSLGGLVTGALVLS